MAQIRTGEQVLERPGYALIEPDSRVVSMAAVIKFAGSTGFAISEAIANPFHVKAVWIRVYWEVLEDGAYIIFRITTGTGRNVDAGIVRYWPAVVPCVYEGADAPWTADARLYEFCWTMNRAYGEQGRRLGLWAYMGAGGVSIATVYASFQIVEGL